MCAIGRDQVTSIGANAAGATLLGSTAIGGNTGSGARRIAGGVSRSTLLTGDGYGTPRPGAPGGGRPGAPIQMAQR